MSRRFIVEADGGSRGNPGPAGYGALVRDAETGRVLAERAASVGRATNNVAEYGGLVAGLQAALDLDPTAEVEVRMDSKLVVEQMSGRWQIKHPDMRQLALQAAADRPASSAGSATPGCRGRRTAPPTPWPTARWTAGRSTGTPPPSPRRGGRRPAGGAEAAPVVTTVTHLLRHGQTEHTPERRFSGRNDLPLSRTGRAEAEAAAARVAELGIEVIVASPLRRTRETAEIVAATLGLPVEFDDDLVELDFGDIEGLTFDGGARRSTRSPPAGSAPTSPSRPRAGSRSWTSARGWPVRAGGSWRGTPGSRCSWSPT